MKSRAAHHCSSKVHRVGVTLARLGLATGATAAFISAVMVFHGFDAVARNGGKTVDPCRLLSVTEVAKAVGASVEEPTPVDLIVPRRGLKACAYATSSKWGTVVVATQRPGRRDFASSQEDAKNAGSTVKPSYQDLRKLGDRAFSLGTRVSVLKRNTFLQVWPQYGIPDFWPIARRLAAQAIRRLP